MGTKKNHGSRDDEDFDGEEEANMDGLCGECGYEICICNQKPAKEDAKLPEEQEPERGVCPVCNSWDCEEHRSAYGDLNAYEAAALTEDQIEQLRKKAREGFKTLTGLSDKDLDFIEEQLEEGETVIVNMGKATTYKKVELTQKEIDDWVKAIEEAEKQEAAEENEDWELPETKEYETKTKKKGGIRMTGGEMMYVDDPRDHDKGTKSGPEDWLEILEETYTNSATTANPRTLTVYRPKPYGERVVDIRNKAMELVPRLRRQLQLAFEAEARVARQRQQKSGAVDAGQVSRLVTEGKDDIFAKKATRKDIKTAVTIVLDDSGSMQEAPHYGAHVSRAGVSARGEELLRSKNGCAAVLAYAMGEVCQQLGIAFEVLSYHAWSYFNSDHYSIIYKSFLEPWMSCRDRIGNYRCDAGTDLPLDGAQFATRRLLSRQEGRRILFFLSDANACNKGIDKLGEFAKEIKRKANISMVGVGIGTETMKQYLEERAVNVLKIDELTDAVFSKLATIIHPH
jgi:cobalamin biosynthesis protein CobT